MAIMIPKETKQDFNDSLGEQREYEASLKEEQEMIRKGLLVYCELDTYAMVKIYEKLKEVA